MRILLLGPNGQVGWELRRSLAPLGNVIACDRRCVDLRDLTALKKTIREISPDFLVNAAAYTAVDKAESEPRLAHRVNAEAVELLATESKRLDAWLVHYSTEYVFDGEKAGPYRETDETHPVGAYGRSKLAGEQAVLGSGCAHLVFRTSWVYAARGTNFPRTILRLASEREELRVVADQFGAPTSAALIADVTAQTLSRISADHDFASAAPGIYHLAAAGMVSWHKYAQFILQKGIDCGNRFRIRPEQIAAIPTAEYATLARRPLNSCLDTSKLRTTLSIALPEWEDHVARVVRELLVRETTHNEA